MSRSTAAAFETAPGNDPSPADATASTEQPSWSEDKNPTRPLPMFRLEEEARRLDQAAAMSCDDDAGGYANSDDEPTVDAPVPSSPEVISAIAAMSSPRPVRVTVRRPVVTPLVITRPAPTRPPRASVAPAAVISQLIPLEPPPFPRIAPFLVMTMPEPALETPSTPAAWVAPPSGFRRKITLELAETARPRPDTEDGRRSEVRLMVRLPKKRDVQTYVVAGIWAMALSLIALLMFMARSA